MDDAANHRPPAGTQVAMHIEQTGAVDQAGIEGHRERGRAEQQFGAEIHHNPPHRAETLERLFDLLTSWFEAGQMQTARLLSQTGGFCRQVLWGRYA
jgi:hypothetical protein